MNRRMIKLFIPLLLVTALTAALTWNVRGRNAAAAAPATQPAASNPVVAWLGGSVNEQARIAGHDPTFDEDLRRLRGELESKRAALAELLENRDSTDAAVRDQVEAVIAANASLQRRVMEHVLALRDHLTPAQQQRLMNLCAASIREGPGWGWRHGKAGAMGGGPSGRNRAGENGRGMGSGFRGGRGPATRESD
jgi:hypothetical protein